MICLSPKNSLSPPRTLLIAGASERLAFVLSGVHVELLACWIRVSFSPAELAAAKADAAVIVGLCRDLFWGQDHLKQ